MDFTDMELISVYAHIEANTTPSAILGLNQEQALSGVEARSAYRNLAKILHPDKCEDWELIDLHTSLFQKVQSAYDELSEEIENGSAGENAESRKLIDESPLALHTRNADFKEALRKQRDRALDAKKAEDEKKAANEAKMARNEYTPGARLAKVEGKAAARQKKIVQERGLQHRLRPVSVASIARIPAKPKPRRDEQRSFHGKPSTTRDFDVPAVSRADIQHREGKALRSGKPVSTSIAEKENKTRSAHSLLQRAQLELEDKLYRGEISLIHFEETVDEMEANLSATTEAEVKGLLQEDQSAMGGMPEISVE